MTGWIIAFVFGSLGTATIIGGLYASTYVTTKECRWCGEALALGTRLDLANQGGVSHGICRPCARKYFDDTLSAIEAAHLANDGPKPRAISVAELSSTTYVHTHSHGG